MEEFGKDWEKVYDRWKDEWKYARDILFHRKSSRRNNFIIKPSEKKSDRPATFPFFSRFQAVDYPTISISNPFLIPYAYYLILVNGLIRITMYSSLQSKSNSIKRLSRKHRRIYQRQVFEKFSLSLCWDSISSYYQEQQNSKLSGLKGSLFLSQAALVSQIAGFIPKGPHWDPIVANIEDEDMRLKVSKVLYEMIEQPEKILSLRSKLRKLVGDMKEQHQELLLCAGLLKKGNCTI